MRTHLTRRTIPMALAAALMLAAAGCGDDNDDADATDDGGTETEAAAADSAYCDVAVDWAIHQMAPFDDTDPAAFRTYWEEYLAFEEEALAAAPEEIQADWQTKLDGQEEAGITAILEKYDYDLAAMEESGSPEEEAAFEAPPDAAAAQVRILDYESQVCGAQQPQAADVSYDGQEPGAYCELVTAQDEQAAAALASGDPAELEAMFDVLEAGSADVVEAAPDAIKDDVTDLTAWTNDQQRAVAETYDYDFVAAMQEGSAQERLDLNHAAEDIRGQFARVIAYEEQVCGG